MSERINITIPFNDPTNVNIQTTGIEGQCTQQTIELAQNLGASSTTVKGETPNEIERTTVQ